MESKEIAKGIIEAGYTQKLIGEILGFTLSNVNAVVYQRPGNSSKNPIIRAAVAIILKSPVDEVFKDHIQYYCRIYSILVNGDKSVNGKP